MLFTARGGHIVVAEFDDDGRIFRGATITVEGYRQALPGASPFRGDYHDYVIAGIEAGVTLRDVQQGRLVLADCAVGPEYFDRIPVLLPAGPVRSNNVELEYGGTKLGNQKPRLAKFRRYIKRPWPESDLTGIGVRAALCFGWASMADFLQGTIARRTFAVRAAVRIGVVTAELLEGMSFRTAVLVVCGVPFKVRTLHSVASHIRCTEGQISKTSLVSDNAKGRKKVAEQ